MEGLEWGPPFYPKCSGCDPGFRSRFGGGDGVGMCRALQYTTLGARLWVKGMEQGSRPHTGKVRSQKPIVSTVLPLNILHLSWNAYWQLAAATLLTHTHTIHQYFVHTNHAPISWNIQETFTILLFCL